MQFIRFTMKKVIKHRSGYSGRQGVQQSIDVLAQKEYKGYFITSALRTDDVRTFAKENGVEVMDGNGLEELIVNSNDPAILHILTPFVFGLEP